MSLWFQLVTICQQEGQTQNIEVCQCLLFDERLSILVPHFWQLNRNEEQVPSDYVIVSTTYKLQQLSF